MTPAERIEKAFDDAHVVIAGYLQPGRRNAPDGKVGHDAFAVIRETIRNLLPNDAGT